MVSVAGAGLMSSFDDDAALASCGLSPNEMGFGALPRKDLSLSPPKTDGASLAAKAPNPPVVLFSVDLAANPPKPPEMLPMGAAAGVAVLAPWPNAVD